MPVLWVALSLVVSGYAFRPLRQHRHFVTLVAITLISLLGAARQGAVSHLWPDHHISRHAESAGAVVVYGRVAAEPDIRPRVTLVSLALDSIAYGDSVRIRTGFILMRFQFDPRYTIHQEIACRGRLRSPRKPGNFGDFDYAEFLERRNVFALFSPVGPLSANRARLHHEWGWTASVVVPVRKWVNARLHRHLSGEPEGLVRGILFGEKTAMSSQTVKAFESTGTLHLLAVSGSNVAVVILVIFGAATFFRLPAQSRIGICLFGVVLFSFLAHNEASVIRASVGGALVLCGRALRRPTEPFNMLGATLLILLCYEPRQLYDIGFQLSFAATLGILVFAHSTVGRQVSSGLRVRAVRALGVALGVSTAAQLAVFPILAGAFNSMPLVTPLSNLICVPLAGMTTAAGLVTLLLAPLGGWPLSVLSASTWIFAQMLLVTVEWFHNLGFPVWQLSTPGPFEWLIYYSGLIGVVVFIRVRRLRRILLLSTLLALNLWLVVLGLKPDADLKVIVVSAGPQFLSLVRWPGGEVWQIGTGESVRDRRTSEIVNANLVRLGWSKPDVTWLMRTASAGASLRTARNHTTRNLKSEQITGPTPPDRMPAGVAGQRPYSVVVITDVNREILELSIRSGSRSISWLSDSRLRRSTAVEGDLKSVVIVPRIDLLPIEPVTDSGVTCWIEGTWQRKRRSAGPGSAGVQVLHTRDNGAIAIALSTTGINVETSFR